MRQLGGDEPHLTVNRGSYFYKKRMLPGHSDRGKEKKLAPHRFLARTPGRKKRKGSAGPNGGTKREKRKERQIWDLGKGSCKHSASWEKGKLAVLSEIQKEGRICRAGKEGEGQRMQKKRD